jgi:hypothetical protein
MICKKTKHKNRVLEISIAVFMFRLVFVKIDVKT